MQKILSLVWFKVYPPHFGGQKGIALFNKYLADYFEIDCLCSQNNEVVEDAGCQVLTELPVSKTQFLNPLVWLKISRQLKRKDYSYVIAEQPYYGLLGPWLKTKSRQLIIHTHNIEWQRFKSLKSRHWHWLYIYERWSLRKADVVLFKTREEKEQAIKNFRLKAANCYVLPYGIEKAKPFNKEKSRRFLQEKYGIKADEKIILFSGTLDYAPNANAVQQIYDTLEPLLRKTLPAFKIVICGRNRFQAFAHLKQLKNDNIIQAGFVDAMENYFAGADAFINPVQIVHGIQTKLFDALNYNLNVVCYEAACKELPSYLKTKIFSTASNDYEAFVNNIIKALTYNFDTPDAFYLDYSWKNIIANFAAYLNTNQPAA